MRRIAIAAAILMSCTFASEGVTVDADSPSSEDTGDDSTSPSLHPPQDYATTFEDSSTTSNFDYGSTSTDHDGEGSDGSRATGSDGRSSTSGADGSDDRSCTAAQGDGCGDPLYCEQCCSPYQGATQCGDEAVVGCICGLNVDGFTFAQCCAGGTLWGQGCIDAAIQHCGLNCEGC